MQPHPQHSGNPSDDKYHRENQQQFVFDFNRREQSQKGLDKYLKTRANIYMSLLTSKQITQEQMKVEFSIDILRSIFASNDLSKLDNKTANSYTKEIQNNLKENLKYLKIIYPRNKKTEIASQLISQIKDCDYLDKAQYDMMAQTQTIFIYNDGYKDSGTQILDQIKHFINKLIQQSRAAFPSFQKILKTDLMALIQQQNPKQAKYINDVFNDSHKFKIGLKIPDDHPEIGDYGSQRFNIQTTQLFRLILKWIQELQKIVQNKQETLLDQKHFKKIVNLDQEYQKEKQSTISKKYKKKNTIDKDSTVLEQSNLFNKESEEEKFKRRKSKKKAQQQQPGLFGSLFKKITDLCSAHQDNKTVEQGILGSFKDLALAMPNQNKVVFESFRYNIGGSPINYYLQGLSGLNANKQSQKFVSNQMKELQQKYFQIIKIVEKNQTVEKFSLTQKKVYSFSQFTYEFLRQMVAQRLVNLVKMLVDFRYSDATGSSESSRQFRQIDLVTFRVSDLNRARLMLTQRQIMLVFNGLQKLHAKGQIHIVKVKNRFNQPMNDTIIVFKITGNTNSPILCQLQLILSKNANQMGDSKAKASEIMNHYLYQIQRATYGPLSELALIIATKDHRIQYLWKISPVIPKKIEIKKHCYCNGNGQMSEEGKKKYEDLNFNIIKQVQAHGKKVDVIDTTKWKSVLPKAFICGICERVYGKAENLFAIMECKNCNFHVCSECQFTSDQATQKYRYKKVFEQIMIFSNSERASSKNLNPPDVEYNINGQQQKKIYTGNMNKFKISLNNKIIRFKNGDSSKKFWGKIRAEYQETIKSAKEITQESDQLQYYGVLLKLSQVFASESYPFIIVNYLPKTKKFCKSVMDNKNLRTEQMDDADLQIKKFDAFFFICSRATNQNEILNDWVRNLFVLNPFLNRKFTDENALDDNLKIRKGLMKLKNVYDDELQLYDMALNEVNFEPFKASTEFGQKLKALRFLNLNGNNLQSIDGVACLQNVQDLRAKNNMIQEIQINSNQKFPKLKKLQISQNWLSKLIVKNHDNIQAISAQNNPFEEIKIINLMNLTLFSFGGQDPDYDFDENMQDDYLEDVDKMQIRNLPKLNNLYWNRISVKPQIFKFNGLDFPRLQNLNFKYTDLQISHLPSSLEYLNAQGLKDQHIDIINKPKLRSVVLKKTSIKTFEIGPKMTKVILRVYDYQNPNLRIEAKNLKEFRIQILNKNEDDELYVEGGQMSEKSSSVISKSKSMKSMNRKNQLESQKSQGSQLKQKESENRPKIFIREFLESDLPNLEILQLTKIGGDTDDTNISFANFKKLKYIELYESPIGGISNLPSTMQTLLVTNKKNKSDAKFDLPYETILNLSKLRLINVKTDSIKLPQTLQSLELQDNSLMQIQGNDCPKLITIKIGNNPNCNFAGLQNSKLPQLSNLTICSSDVQQLQFANQLQSLRRLDLSDNRVISMEWIFNGKFPNLEELILQRNTIQNLVIKEHLNLKTIFLNENPMMNVYEDVKKIQAEFENGNLYNIASQLQCLSVFPINNLGTMIQSQDYENAEQIQEIVSVVFDNIYNLY